MVTWHTDYGAVNVATWHTDYGSSKCGDVRLYTIIRGNKCVDMGLAWGLRKVRTLGYKEGKLYLLQRPFRFLNPVKDST